MNIYKSTVAYLYKWTDLTNNKWYIGSRTKQGCHPDDGYICSSRYLKPLIQEDTNRFKRDILCLGNPEYILALENRLLSLLDAKNDPMSYNLHNGDGKFTTAGVSPWNKGKHTPIGKPSWNAGLTKESNPSLAKMSQTLQGRIPVNKGKKMSSEFCSKMKELHQNRSEETRRKISEANKGKSQTEETNKKRSEKLKGHKQSPEHVANRITARRGKTNTKVYALKGQPKPKLVCRLDDRKEMTIANFKQWIKQKGY